MPVIVSANPIALAQSSNTGIFGATTEFLRNRLDSLSSLGSISEQFMNTAWQMYDQFHGSDIMRQVRAVTQQVGSVFTADEVRLLRSLSEFQSAQPIMQRFVMACPDYREMYLRFEADGYSESYVNYHGNDLGAQHHDYRLVMDGAMVQEGDELMFKIFHEEHEEGDLVRLDIHNKIDIRRSWDYLRFYLQQRQEDPGSIYCDKF